MLPAEMSSNRKSRALLGPAVTLLFIGVAAAAFLYPAASGTATARAESPEAETVSTGSSQSKYSKFSHDVPEHKKKECSECHKFPSSNWEKVRSEADAFPDITDYPKHDSCVSCHRQQFFSGPKPVICSICHTNPSPMDSSRHPFPNPRDLFDKSEKGKTSFSSFAVYFPHELHIAMLGSNTPETGRSNGALFMRASLGRKFQSDSCAMCHQLLQPQGDGDDEYVTKTPEDLGDSFWLKKGTFMSAPTDHSQCFTCHSADAGLNPAPVNCSTCHKLQPKDLKTDFSPEAAKRMSIDDKLLVASWRKRNSAATFRHEWFSHAEIECTTCHVVGEIDTADPKVKTVKLASCNYCHITGTSDDGGILNYEIDSRKKDPKFQCVKCHLGYSGLPVPESHPAVIKELAGN